MFRFGGLLYMFNEVSVVEEKNYEQKVRKEATYWVKRLSKRSPVLQRTSKKFQTKMNAYIPNKVHQVVTDSVRKMIELSLTSAHYIHPIEVDPNWTLEQREKVVEERLQQYKRTAALEGAGTGAGGILLGLADFPLLLSIKMKFLFDVGRVYGYDVYKYEERMYLLHLFILAFSSDKKRMEVLEEVLNWDRQKGKWREVDWKTLQVEYRDTIDFVKMFQLIPGIGAVVGAVANYRLLDQLGETAMNAYRLRLLDQE